MRTPIVVAALAGALVLGGTAAVAATASPARQPADSSTPSQQDMRQMHDRMLREYPEVGPAHERMLDDIPGMRGMHEGMMGGS